MYGRTYRIIIAILLCTVSLLVSAVPTELKILAIRVEFPVDDNEGTSGDGSFLLNILDEHCGKYTIDPPPHDRNYFESQIKAVDNYYRTISEQNFGIDLTNSIVYPLELNQAYQMPNEMGYYHPLSADLEDDEKTKLHEERIVELLVDAVNAAYRIDNIDFDKYDIVVVFHAGISQDFKIDLDITPEDIPSTFIDNSMIQKSTGSTGIVVGNNVIEQGIILPETQNHIFYPEFVENYQRNGTQNICQYQYGLTGTFAMLIGQAIGLPPLWNTENGLSGVGVFGLLDQGSNNGHGVIPALPTAWSRILMDWEKVEVIIPDEEVIVESQPAGKVLRIDINENEYFLIENRTNWFRNNVNLDSAQLAVYNRVDTIPNVINFIFDSIGVEVDHNGVILSVPDYDIGLPGSGLLIWHIDDNVITDNIGTKSINNDLKYKGVDLEEAGGSQDIGYVSTALFRDPSRGEIFDLWYSGNLEYEAANKNNNDAIEFSPFTFPNTNSNRGSNSNLSISNIGIASDTVLISISNNLTLDGFPDNALSIIYQVDLDADGESEIIGGKDTLWWSRSDAKIRHNFYHLPSEKNYFTFTKENDQNKLVVLSEVGDSLKIAWFELNDQMDLSRTEQIQNDYHAISHISGNESDSGIKIIEKFDSIYLVKDKTGKNVEVVVFADGGLKIGDQPIYLNEVKFQYISAIDIDLDGEIEVLATDDDGKLYAFNQNYTPATGFPIDYEAVAPILAKDIFGDDYPEIIFKNAVGNLIILNNKGERQYYLSGNKNSELIMLGNYDGKNTVVTETNIWVFDKLNENNGNEWTTYFGDEYNSITIRINYSAEINEQNKLIDKKKTYIYPNPVRNNKAKIRVYNYSASKVEIKIYDAAGYFVDEIIEDIDIVNGVWEVEWDVSKINAGVYLLKLQAIKNGIEESIILKVGVIH